MRSCALKRVPLGPALWGVLWTLAGCIPSDFDNLATTDDAGTAAEESRAWWQPMTVVSWQWQLSGALDTSYDVAMYNVDLFTVSAASIAGLQSEGRKVICHLSAGSHEDWRSDAAEFPAAVIGAALDNVEGERWLDVRSQATRALMLARLELARDKGCDGVEPDNVDGYLVDSGFLLTMADLVDYVRFLADESHRRGLSVGLTNAVELVDMLEPNLDWALNAECLRYEECERLRPFLDAGKPVFHVEYVESVQELESAAERICGAQARQGFNTLVKARGLGPASVACAL